VSRGRPDIVFSGLLNLFTHLVYFHGYACGGILFRLLITTLFTRIKEN